MKTKADAEARLARVGLLRPVAVADVADPERGERRSFQFGNERDESQTIVEIDADPSPRQLADLASNLPLPEDKRMAALAIMTQDAAPTLASRMVTGAAIGGGAALAASAAAALAHFLGFL